MRNPELPCRYAPRNDDSISYHSLTRYIIPQLILGQLKPDQHLKA